MAFLLQERPHAPPVQATGGAARILDARIRELYRYWLRKRRGRPARARANIDQLAANMVLGISCIDEPRLRPADVTLDGTRASGALAGPLVDERIVPDAE